MILFSDKAVIEYERTNLETFRFTETIVPEAYRGQGIAGKLATVSLITKLHRHKINKYN